MRFTASRSGHEDQSTMIQETPKLRSAVHGWTRKYKGLFQRFFLLCAVFLSSLMTTMVSERPLPFQLFSIAYADIAYPSAVGLLVSSKSTAGGPWQREIVVPEGVDKLSVSLLGKSQYLGGDLRVDRQVDAQASPACDIERTESVALCTLEVSPGERLNLTVNEPLQGFHVAIAGRESETNLSASIQVGESIEGSLPTGARQVFTVETPDVVNLTALLQPVSGEVSLSISANQPATDATPVCPVLNVDLEESEGVSVCSETIANAVVYLSVIATTAAEYRLDLVEGVIPKSSENKRGDVTEADSEDREPSHLITLNAADSSTALENANEIGVTAAVLASQSNVTQSISDAVLAFDGEDQPAKVIQGKLASGSWRYYSVTVPGDVSRFSATLAVAELQNGDLYLKKDAQPSLTDFDCASQQGVGFHEKCVMDVNEGEVIHVGIYAQSAVDYVAFSAIESSVENVGSQLHTSEMVSKHVEQGAMQVYSLSAGEADTIVASLGELSDDADLYLGLNRLPSTSDYDCKSDRDGYGVEYCRLDGTEGSTVYLGVYGKAAADFLLSVGIQVAGSNLSADAANNSWPEVFEQNSEGILSIEAEAAVLQDVGVSRWQVQAQVQASGGQQLTKIGGGFSSVNEGPKARLRFKATRSGDHDVWVRVLTETNGSGNGDSFYWAFDEKPAVDKHLWGPSQVWFWQKVATEDLTQDQEHQIEIQAREDLFIIDKLVIQPTGSAAPSGFGPAVSGGADGSEPIVTGAIPELPTSTVSSSDTDGDGLPDSWEQLHFGSLNATAKEDSDNDSRSNAEEYASDSDPTYKPSLIADLKSRPKTPGTVGGILDVSQNGAATYSVPLELPPGINGQAPSLALNYSSQAGLGPMGTGWTMSGLSSISRCPRTNVLNGEHHPVDFSDKDLLCLDGQQLLPTDNNYSNYWSSGKTFHPAMDPTTRVSIKAVDSKGPTWILLERPNGHDSIYGSKPNVTASGFAGRLFRDFDGRAVANSWNMTRSEDLSGNAIVYRYASTKSGGNNWAIDTIDYGFIDGDSGYHTQVKFSYVDSDIVQHLRFAEDWVWLSKNLSRIDVSQGANGTEKNILSYGLEYADIDTNYKNRRNARLEAILKCSPTECVQSDVYKWRADQRYNPSTETLWSSNGWTEEDSDQIAVADFNLDGRQDVFSVRTGTASLRLGTATVGSYSTVSAFEPGKVSVSGSPKMISGDFDGDGKPDVLLFGRGNLAYGTGDGVNRFDEQAPLWANSAYLGWILREGSDNFTSGDFDGDGRTDFFVHGVSSASNDYGQVFFATGNRTSPFETRGATFTPTGGYLGGFLNSQTMVHPGDFNGDGIGDLFLVDPVGGYRFGAMYFGTGVRNSPFTKTILWPGNYNSYLNRSLGDNDQFVVADFNADGATDIFKYNADGTIYYGTRDRGNPFFARTLFSSGDSVDGWSTNSVDTYSAVDVDGNGVPDLIVHRDYKKESGVVNDSPEFEDDGQVQSDGGEGGETFSCPFSITRSSAILLGTSNVNVPFSRFTGAALPTSIRSGSRNSIGSANCGRARYEKSTDLSISTVDANQDGVADLFVRDGDAGKLIHWNKPADVIDQFGTANFPDRNKVEYGQTTDFSLYDFIPSTVSLTAVPEKRSGRRLVKKLHVSNGKGGYQTSAYKYYNGAVDISGLGNLGFERRSVFDESSGVNRHAYYLQNYPFTGQLRIAEEYCCSTAPIAERGQQQNASSSSIQSRKAWSKLSATAPSWSNGYHSGGAFYTRVESSQQRTADPESGEWHTDLITRYKYADAANKNGQALEITSVTTDLLDENQQWTTKTTNTPESDDTSNWLIGRVKSTAVVHSVLGAPEKSQSRESAFEYNSKGQVAVEIVEPGKVGSVDWQRKETLYDDRGYANDVKVTGVVDSAGQQATRHSTAVTSFNALYGKRNVVSSNALGQSSTSVFSLAHGGLLSATGINGLVSTSTYDDFGRPTASFAPDGSWSSTSRSLCEGACAIDAYAKTVSKSSDGASAVSYTDILEREVATTSLGLGGEPISQYTKYNSRGFVSHKSVPVKGIGAASAWAETEYDIFGRVSKETPPDIQRAGIVTYGYSGRTTTKHLPTREAVNQFTDINGNTHAQSHSVAVAGAEVVSINNARNKLIKSTDVEGSSNSFDYDALDQLITSTDALDRSTGIQLDVHGRKLSMDSPEMGHWSYGYNSFGELIRQQDANGNVVTLEYDVLGRLLERNETEGKTLWHWDSAEGAGKGKLASVTSPGGIARGHVYDDLGRAAQTTVIADTRSYTTAYGYDALGRGDRLAFPDSGVSIKRVFDEAGHLSRVLDGRDDSLLWQVTEVNALGQLSRQQFGNGLETLKNYDSITGQIDSTQTATVGGTAVVVTGDGAFVQGSDNVVSLEVESAERSAGVTADWQALSDSSHSNGQALGVGVSSRVAYGEGPRLMWKVKAIASGQYDIWARMRNTSWGNSLFYNFDGDQGFQYFDSSSTWGWRKLLNRTPVFTANTEHQLEIYARDAGVEIDKLVLIPKGSAFTFSGHGPAESHREGGGMSAGNGESHHERYGYDRWGNLIAREDVASDSTELFAYDSLNRLTRSTIDNNLTQVMAYDQAGNITSKTSATHTAAHVGDYLYEAQTGRLHSAGGEVLTYDDNGNMLSGRDKTVQWNSFNKATSISKGSVEQHFQYDAERTRILSVIGEKRTITLDPALAGMGGLSIETDGTTGQVKYQHTIIAGGVPVASIVTLKDDTQPDVESETSYLHVDRMGSVVMVTDTLGKMQTKTVFDTWGLRRSSRHAAVDDPFALALRHSATDRGYTQHQMLDDVGLIHMNARLYDPVLARFISADSVAPSPGFSQGLNRYSYVYNNPFGSTDPSGNNPWAILAFLLIAGGVATNNAGMIQLGFALIPGANLFTAAMGGFTAGWVSGGGSWTQAFRGGLFTVGGAVAFGGVHKLGDKYGLKAGGFSKVVLHGLVGGTMASLQGGSFKTGFRSAAMSQLLAPHVDKIGKDVNQLTGGERVARAAASASVGALTAHATGGDPATGAVTAAFGRLYNDDKKPSSYDIGRKGEDDVDRAIRRQPGNKMIGRNIKYYLVDKTGAALLRGNGKRVFGELDGIYRDKFGVIQPYEVKTGPTAKFPTDQSRRTSFIDSGRIKFYGKSAFNAGLSGRTLNGFSGGNFGRLELWIGRGTTSRRALRQYFRQRFN